MQGIKKIEGFSWTIEICKPKSIHWPEPERLKELRKWVSKKWDFGKYPMRRRRDLVNELALKIYKVNTLNGVNFDKISQSMEAIAKSMSSLEKNANQLKRELEYLNYKWRNDID